MGDLGRIVDLLLGLAWNGVALLTAAAALWRFRLRPAGVLLALGFGLLGLKGLVMQLVYRTLFGELSFDDPWRMGIQIGSWAVSLLLSVVTVVGVAVLPLSAVGPGPASTPSPRVPIAPSTLA